jgi:hypothetical protein
MVDVRVMGRQQRSCVITLHSLLWSARCSELLYTQSVQRSALSSYAVAIF